MSLFTPKDRLVDEILKSLNDVVQARPHMRKTARFTPPEMRAYCEGYYWGATYALRVVVEAIRRVEEITKITRSLSRKKRSA